MKIVHLANIPVPRNHPQYTHVVMRQHPGRWGLNHVLAQKAAGLDVEVVSQAHKASCDFECKIEGVTVHFLRTFYPYRHFTFYALDAWRMARLVRSLHPDIVHVHGTEAAYGHAAIRSGVPFCVTAQGLFFQIIPKLGRPPTWNERFLRWGENMVWRRTRFAIAKSGYVRDALVHKYPHLDLALIPNTYEPLLDAPLGSKWRHDIAFVGTIDERKGIHILAKAMKEVVNRVPDVRLHIIGNSDGDEATKGYPGDQLRSLRETLGERLILHGKIPSQQVFRVLDICVLLVAPSLEEMFGNQLIEGLMRGCHGIVSDGTAMAENIRRFGNGTIVPQQDSATLAETIAIRLLKPPSLKECEHARQNIRFWMSPPVVAAKHVDFYNHILFGNVASSRCIV